MMVCVLLHDRISQIAETICQKVLDYEDFHFFVSFAAVGVYQHY